MKYVIDLPPVTKKNSQRIFRARNGRPFIKPSAAYEDYEEAAGYFLRPRPPEPLDRPCEVKCLFYMPTRRRVDLANLLEAVDDVLVRYGVLRDDNSQIVASHDGSRVLYDKGHPRTEIEIKLME